MFLLSKQVMALALNDSKKYYIPIPCNKKKTNAIHIPRAMKIIDLFSNFFSVYAKYNPTPAITITAIIINIVTCPLLCLITININKY